MDLFADPGQRRDLAEHAPELLRELAERLATWRANVGARLPTRPAGGVEDEGGAADEREPPGGQPLRG